MNRTVQPRQPTREGQSLKREDERIRELTDAPILEGRLTDSETVSAAGSRQIRHGLGRKPNGYFVAQFTASAAVTEPLRDLAINEHFIELQNDSAVDVTVKLWVF